MERNGFILEFSVGILLGIYLFYLWQAVGKDEKTLYTRIIFTR